MSRVLSCVMTTETLIAPTRAERDTVTSWRVERLLEAGSLDVVRRSGGRDKVAAKLRFEPAPD